MVKTLETLRAADSSAADVADALSVDPGLTVRLLKLVNSAGFGRLVPVSSIDQAVAVAGFGAVESIVLSVGVTSALPTVSVEGFDHSPILDGGKQAGHNRKIVRQCSPSGNGKPVVHGRAAAGHGNPDVAIARPDYRKVLLEWHGGGDELTFLNGPLLAGPMMRWPDCCVTSGTCPPVCATR